MDRRERIDNPVTALQAALEGLRADVWTALPGILQSFDAAKVTAVVQAAIQPQLLSPQGEWQNVTIPLCLDVPVVFPSGGGFMLTMPLADGDEGLLVFASRCIDGWWQSSGVQPQADLRMHDLSDGFFIPGVWSQPRVPGGISTTSTQLRSLDGNTVVEVAGGGVARIKAPGGLIIQADVAITGSVSASGGISAGAGGVDAVNLQTHRHGGVTPGGGNTDVPVPGS